jgi:site-specific DNA-methyltransferase (adenine-specific)
MLELDRIYNMDCIEGMKQIDDKSIDMILCDLPYGLTSCDWDSILSLNDLWIQYKRIIKENSVIVLTSIQPFTSDLINSNRDWFRYEWIWYKDRGGNIFNCDIQPMNVHENILVFAKNKPVFYPQMERRRKGGTDRFKYPVKVGDMKDNAVYGKTNVIKKKYNNKLKYPLSIQCFSTDRGLHPTQKPIKFCEYFIKTYSNEGDLVLDNCIGSGTTAVACKRLNRHFIGFEISKEYCDIANKRLANVPNRLENWNYLN